MNIPNPHECHMKTWLHKNQIYCNQYVDPKGNYFAQPFECYYCLSCGQMYHLNLVLVQG
jgi:hypothetical protein